MNTTIDQAMAAFCRLAEVVITEGICDARADDPHRFATVPAEFDQGRAMRRLAVDYLAGGQVRVALQLLGSQRGAPHAVEMFSITVQGPVAGTSEGMH